MSQPHNAAAPQSTFDSYEFWLGDYKLWLDYRAQHSDRMWTRFNYFLTIEGALIAFFTITTDQFLSRARWASLAQVIISIMWALVGARDAYLWRVIDHGVEVSALNMKMAVPDCQLNAYNYVGVSLYNDKGGGRLAKGMGRLLGFDQSNLSVTSMAARFPLLACLLWSAATGAFFAGSSVAGRILGALIGLAILAVVLAAVSWLTGIRSGNDRPGTSSDGGAGSRAHTQ